MIREVLGQAMLRHLRVVDVSIGLAAVLVVGAILTFIPNASGGETPPVLAAFGIGLALGLATLVMQADHDGPTLSGALRAGFVLGLLILGVSERGFAWGAMLSQAPLVLGAFALSLCMYALRRYASTSASF